MDKKEFLKEVSVGGKSYGVYDINRLGEKGIADVGRLPFSIKILVENLLRKLDGRVVLEEDLLNIAKWQKRYAAPVEILYHPARVLMQDFTGLPAVVDLAAMRDAMKNMGGDPQKINPLVPVNQRLFDLELNGSPVKIGDGSIVIAAITSCTNTSNPFVLIGAGLLARNAVKRGLRVPPYVKTSLAPGSKVVNRYLEAAGVMPYLEALGFHTAGFGCTTCIGNSGPLHPVIEQAVRENDLNVASVLSGNRNFEARIHQSIKSNFLASPMLVVAFALAGRIDTDLYMEPVGIDPNGEPVYMNEIWPDHAEIAALVSAHVKKEFYREEYGRIFEGDEFWQELDVTESTTYAWDETSTYIKNPPYFENFSKDAGVPSDIAGAQTLLVLGDTVTTDHISPAGAIPAEYPAGKYLISKSVPPAAFNSYGSRRGNHEVMMRGTFGNIRIKNSLVDPKEGSFTLKFPDKKEMFVYEAAMQYKESALR